MNPEVVQYEVLAKELLQRVNAEEEPADMHDWLTRRLAALGTGNNDAALFWPESFDWYDALLAKREELAKLPPEQRHLIDWPWASWNRLIDPLAPGMLASITAPDGQGKTIVVECLAEHWASRAHKVVFVHYELNRALMLDRRMSRHTSLPVRALRSGTLTADQRKQVTEVRPRLLAWEGGITYLHTPGWTMEQTTTELRKLHAEGLCDVAVIDYLEKVAPSPRQMKMFGANVWQREADNVEQLKVFAESAEIPVAMVAQMNKAGKSTDFGRMDRSDMTGSADKSNKANLVVLLKRDRDPDGNYSNTVHVQVDKNTMGATGAFDQFMQPEYFRLADIYREAL
jgi:replicative DNA helicase